MLIDRNGRGRSGGNALIVGNGADVDDRVAAVELRLVRRNCVADSGGLAYAESANVEVASWRIGISHHDVGERLVAGIGHGQRVGDRLAIVVDAVRWITGNI